MKYLVLILVVGVVLWLMFGRRRGGAPPRRPPRRGATEEMVDCAHCGVHLPRGDALQAGGRWYCSDAHRIAGPRRDA